MEVILQEDFPALGYVGDKVRVKDGYARNFLIPKGIGVEASARNVRVLNHILGAILKKKAKMKSEAEVIAAKFDGLIIEFTVKLGDTGKAFGSITSKDIEAALIQKGFTIERRQIRIGEPIKSAGEHRVEVKLHSEVIAHFVVRVIAEKAPEPVEAAEDGRGRRRGKPGRRRKGDDTAKDGGDSPAEGATGEESSAG